MISDERNDTNYVHDSFDRAVLSKDTSVTSGAKFVRGSRDLIEIRGS